MTMKELIKAIDVKNAAFAQSDIFTFLRDEAIEPQARLCFAPYMAHFVFSFMDINRFIIRDLQQEDAYQKLINIHSYEDAHHWPWYLHDLKKLGLDKQQSLSDTLLFLWGDKTMHSRLITYEMCALSKSLTSKQRIILVEIIEKTGSVFLAETANVVRQCSDQNLMYYGDHHLACETGHHMGTDNVEDIIYAIDIDDEEYQRGLEIIEQVFDLYQNFVDEMYSFTQANDFYSLLKSARYRGKVTQEKMPD